MPRGVYSRKESNNGFDINFLKDTLTKKIQDLKLNMQEETAKLQNLEKIQSIINTNPELVELVYSIRNL